MTKQKKGDNPVTHKKQYNNNIKREIESRTRNYATVLYPESMPSDWLDKLEAMHTAYLISPLHDKDINPTGEPKKPHYHLIILFDNVKSSKQAKELFDVIGGVGCEPINAIRGYARYLCHLDNPEKAQYSTFDVKARMVDYQEIISLSTDRYKAIADMQEFCEKYTVLSFSTLCKYARTHNLEWHKILCDSGAVIMQSYLKSLFWSKGNPDFEIIIDPATGKPLE